MSKFSRKGYSYLDKELSAEAEQGQERQREEDVKSSENKMLQSMSENLEETGETVYIAIDRIRPNSKNAYKMSDIEKLSGMIKLAGGIWQNLIVKPADEEGYYTITTGERRWRAAKRLWEQGEYPEKLQGKVPCTIKTMNEIELPLNEGLKEEFAILVTNQYRTKTDGELMMEMQKWKKIIGELRKANVQYLPTGYDEEEGEKIQIQGTPTRKLVAKQLGISTGSVSTLENVEKNASNHLMELLMADKMNLSAAKELARLDKKEQNQVIESIEKEEKTITTEAVKKEVNRRQDKIRLDKKTVSLELTAITNLLDEDVELTEAEYRKYKRLIEQLKTIFK